MRARRCIYLFGRVRQVISGESETVINNQMEIRKYLLNVEMTMVSSRDAKERERFAESIVAQPQGFRYWLVLWSAFV